MSKLTGRKTKTKLPTLAVELARESPLPAPPRPASVGVRAHIPLRRVNIHSRPFRGSDLRMPRGLLTLPLLRDLSSNAKLVYMVLLDCVRPASGNSKARVAPNGDVFCEYSNDEIAQLLGISGRTVTSAINELRRLKLVDTISNGSQPNKVYVYEIGAADMRVTRAKFAGQTSKNCAANCTQPRTVEPKNTLVNSTPENNERLAHLWYDYVDWRESRGLDVNWPTLKRLLAQLESLSPDILERTRIVERALENGDEGFAEN